MHACLICGHCKSVIKLIFPTRLKSSCYKFGQPSEITAQAVVQQIRLERFQIYCPGNFRISHILTDRGYKLLQRLVADSNLGESSSLVTQVKLLHWNLRFCVSEQAKLMLDKGRGRQNTAIQPPVSRRIHNRSQEKQTELVGTHISYQH